MMLVCLQKSVLTVGHGQNRNAVASGQFVSNDFSWKYGPSRCDPTLPRYGTDLLQVRLLTFVAKPVPIFQWKSLGLL